jgi:hypothetical protein|tara:strand:+ start:1976 stop:2143 length:168 start_codon:yes stop_codon:yes gene_type:complete
MKWGGSGGGITEVNEFIIHGKGYGLILVIGIIRVIRIIGIIFSCIINFGSNIIYI